MPTVPAIIRIIDGEYPPVLNSRQNSQAAAPAKTITKRAIAHLPTITATMTIGMRIAALIKRLASIIYALHLGMDSAKAPVALLECLDCFFSSLRSKSGQSTGVKYNSE